MSSGNVSRPLTVVMVSSEETTVAKQGGAADVTHDLPEAWQSEGVNVIRIIPFHGVIDRNGPYEIEDLGITITGKTDRGELPARMFLLKQPGGVPTILLQNHPYFTMNRSGYMRPYDSPFDITDGTVAKYAYFDTLIGPAARALAQHRPDLTGGGIDAFVLNDWMTVPFAAQHYMAWQNDPYIGEAVNIAILHNVGNGYRGEASDMTILSGMGLTPEIQSAFMAGPDWFTFLGGLAFAHGAVTVSPTYHDETLHTEFSGILAPQLNTLNSLGRYIGILNGGNYEYWNPERLGEIRDTGGIPYRAYSAQDMSGKAINKRMFLDFHGIKFDPQNPPVVASFNSRLAEQKAPDVLARHIPYMIEKYNWVIVLHGDGEKKYRDLFNELEKKYPKNIINLTKKDNNNYSDSQAMVIRGASDFEFITSRFEPCGLSDIQAMAFGVVPIVTATGGLNDKVVGVDSPTLRTLTPEQLEQRGVTGFLINRLNDDMAFRSAIDDANYVYGNAGLRTQMVQNAISARFDWQASAERYLLFIEHVIAMNEELRASRSVYDPLTQFETTQAETLSEDDIMKGALLSGLYQGASGRMQFIVEHFKDWFLDLKKTFDEVYDLAISLLDESAVNALGWTREDTVPKIVGVDFLVASKDPSKRSPSLDVGQEDKPATRKRTRERRVRAVTGAGLVGNTTATTINTTVGTTVGTGSTVSPVITNPGVGPKTR